MIKLKQAKMNRVTFLVLDEADRMFDMGPPHTLLPPPLLCLSPPPLSSSFSYLLILPLGFEPQVRSIVGQINPKRQSTFTLTLTLASP